MNTSYRPLLQEALEAHGGIDRWNQFQHADIHALVGGIIWAVKGVPGILTDFHYEIDLHAQRGTFPNFVKPGQHATFQADRVAIETDDGTVVEELVNPRDSLRGQTLQTPWSTLQLIYFAGYAMWTYMTTPFCFTMPGFAAEEIDPSLQGNETWRRLKVTFPDYLARHSREQIYYLGPDGLVRRNDYVAEAISMESAAAHVIHDNKEFSGITIGTRRRVYALNPDGSYNLQPILVAIDVEDISFS